MKRKSQGETGCIDVPGRTAACSDVARNFRHGARNCVTVGKQAADFSIPSLATVVAFRFLLKMLRILLCIRTLYVYAIAIMYVYCITAGHILRNF